METVAIQIPASLYAALYARYGDETTMTAAAHLAELAGHKGVASVQTDDPNTQYPRPGPGTKTRRVWEIADEIKKKFGKADREAVIKACMSEGLNINTASTQFSYWLKVHG